MTPKAKKFKNAEAHSTTGKSKDGFTSYDTSKKGTSSPQKVREQNESTSLQDRQKKAKH